MLSTQPIPVGDGRRRLRDLRRMPSPLMTSPQDLHEFRHALARLPDGYSEGHFNGRRWGVTVKRSADGRRAWLFAEELGGSDIVSFNWYSPYQGSNALKPCEMSSSKVIEFVVAFKPGAEVGQEPVGNPRQHSPREHDASGQIEKTA
ncbi:hypothetical protein [Rhizobium sp. A37_96]